MDFRPTQGGLDEVPLLPGYPGVQRGGVRHQGEPGRHPDEAEAARDVEHGLPAQRVGQRARQREDDEGAEAAARAHDAVEAAALGGRGPGAPGPGEGGAADGVQEAEPRPRHYRQLDRGLGRGGEQEGHHRASCHRYTES